VDPFKDPCPAAVEAGEEASLKVDRQPFLGRTTPVTAVAPRPLPSLSVADPDRFGPDPDPTSENRPDPVPDPDSDPVKSGSGFI
jgi:hypothetical protein